MTIASLRYQWFRFLHRKRYRIWAFLMAKFRRTGIPIQLRPPIATIAYTGISWPMIRYSDVLLMYAEAENELRSVRLPPAAISCISGRYA